MSTSPMTTVDRLRQAIAETLSIDAQGLQAAIGQLVVATSADYPAAGPEARSLHSSAVRTTVLLADRIPAGQEAQALAQEIARHHGQEAAQAVLGERAAELLSGDGKLAARILPATSVVEYQALLDRWRAADGTAKSSDITDSIRVAAADEVEAVSEALRLSPSGLDVEGRLEERNLSNYTGQANVAEQGASSKLHFAQGSVDLVAHSVPTLNEFRESRQFVPDLHRITGDARDQQVRAFHYQGDVFLRLNARDAACSIEVHRRNWGGQNAVYQAPRVLVEGDAKEYFSPPSGAVGIAPGMIVCNLGQGDKYTLKSFHRLAFEYGLRALEEILYEQEFLREHVPAQAAERALRVVYERSPEYSDPQLGGGDFMQMVEKFAQEPFYAHHHLARHLQYLSGKMFDDCDYKAEEYGSSPSM